jgi:transcriptional regulator with XRE-family HTH domain
MDGVKLGLRIKQLREAKRISQADLARLAGTSPTTLSSIELGKTDTSVGMLQEIAKALGTTASALLSEGDAPHALEDCVRVVTEAALNRSPSPPLDSLDRRALAALAAVDDPETKAWLVERLTRAAEVAAKPVGGKNSNGDEEESG